MKLPAIEVERKSGDESFFSKSVPVPISLNAFWQWSSSDLISNTLRGILAEFIVASALGVNSGVRTEWDAFDILTPDGIKIEVKSAAYIQSWAQKKHSTISFGIRPTQGWNASTGEYSLEKKRQADVYIFCLLVEKNQAIVNPLILDQWVFYVLGSTQLDRQTGNQKTISLSSLVKMDPIEAKYSEIRHAVKNALTKGRLI